MPGPETGLLFREQVEDFRRRFRTGLVTLLFTDVVGSTKLKQTLGDRAGVALLQHHHAVVRELLREFPEGSEISTAGDSFFLVFVKPSDAVRFALLLHTRNRDLTEAGRPSLQDRIGIHLGEVVVEEADGRERDLHGLQVDLAARVMGLAEGGQVLLSRSAFDNARQALRGEELPGLGALHWLHHGSYQLKGVDDAVEICEVGEAGIAPLKAPDASEKAQRQVRPDEESVLGWRPAVGQEVPNTRWVLEEKLGEGGFGEVWKARHEKLREHRVFKFCFRADRVRSLKREVTLFRLMKDRIGEHPHIVKLHDICFDQPPFYLEEEYVDGKDLKTWCEAQGGIGTVPMPLRLAIVAQAAEALQAAHDAGIVHRDIKPGNILLASPPGEGHPPTMKLSDFGIGQVVSAECLRGLTQAGFTQTLLGSTSSQTGTQMYMAPELLTGRPATPRSDLYSLGVVLFQAVVGDFGHPLTTDWAKSIEDPLLLEDLQGCFAGKPEDRFGGAAELAKRLRQLPARRVEQARQQAERAALERAAYRRGVARSLLLASFVAAAFAALGLLAVRARNVATQQRERAESSEREALRLLYFARINLIGQAWEQHNLARVRQLLQETASHSDRGFEWYYWQRQAHLELRTLRGHAAAVTSVGFAPDGQRLVTGSEDHTARVWEVATGRELLLLTGHTGSVHSAAFSSDGRRILTASDDRTVRLWDARSGRESFRFNAPTGSVAVAAFSPDGGRILTSGSDQTVRVWDTSTGEQLVSIRDGRKAISTAAFSPDGRRIATGSRYGALKVWDAQRGKHLLTLDDTRPLVESVAFAPEGRRLVTGDSHMTAKIWDTASGGELLTLGGHGGPVHAVVFSPDGRRIVTGSQDQTANIWDATDGRMLRSLVGHGDYITSVAVSPDGTRVATAGRDRLVKLWDATQDRSVLVQTCHTESVRCAAFSPDGRLVVTASEDGTAKVWEAATGGERLTLTGHEKGLSSASFSRDGRRIVTSGWDGTARLWDADSGRQLLILRGHTNSMLSWAVFSPDGRQVVTSSRDWSAKVWDAANGRELLTLSGHSGPVRRIDISPDGRRVVTSSEDQTARVWDLATGEELLTLAGHRDWISQASFSPDGRRIVTASKDRTAKVWDATDGTLLLTLVGHRDWINSAAFSPDGRRIVTCSDDLTTRMWDAATGQGLLTLQGPEDWVLCVAFSPDGSRLVSAGVDKTARVWSAATPEQVAHWQAEERDHR